MSKIYFHHYTRASAHIKVSKSDIKKAIKNLCAYYQKEIEYINLIFVSANKMRSVNKKYLNHDYDTDVITFSLSDEVICSDIFICDEVICMQAKEYKTSVEKEFLRVILHGILHLCGFMDKSSKEKQNMRRLENKFLKLYFNL